MFLIYLCVHTMYSYLFLLTGIAIHMVYIWHTLIVKFSYSSMTRETDCFLVISEDPTTCIASPWY